MRESTKLVWVEFQQTIRIKKNIRKKRVKSVIEEGLLDPEILVV